MCLAAGCTAYLTKPIKQDVLLQAIKELAQAAPPIPKPDKAKIDAGSSDRRIAERAPTFLRNTRLNAIAMQDALDRGDLDTVVSLGHRMHGAGGMFGFQGITDLGATIEQAAQLGEIDAIRASMKELSNYLDRAEHVPEPTIA
jgi:HPt (histidine-containing phosphotransfer) domain-containing protein